MSNKVLITNSQKAVKVPPAPHSDPPCLQCRAGI